MRITLLLLFSMAACTAPYDRRVTTAREQSLYGSELEISTRGTGGDPSTLAADADVEDYVAFGLLNNPGLRAAFERWRAAVERIAQASTLPDPTFSYAHFVEEIQTRTGPQRNRFGLSQTIPWFGKLQLRGDIAAAEAESLWWQVQARRLALVREIKSTYHEYAYLAQAIQITDAN